LCVERADIGLEGSATYTDTELRGFMLIALEAGVPIAELKFLLNHAVSSGGVTMGYLHPSLHHLRGW
jgi:hypothetical protein